MNNSTIFYTIFSGFISAVFICSFVKLDFGWVFFTLILSLCIFIYGKFFAEGKDAIILLSIFIFSFTLGILRYELKEIRNIEEDRVLSSLVGEKVYLTGVVADEPATKESSTNLIVEVEKIDGSGSEKGEYKFSDSRVLVSVGLFPRFKYGDKVQVMGKLEKPENFTSTSGADFDYVGFLSKDDIFYQLTFANGKIISSGHGSLLRSKLFEFKNSFVNRINLAVREPESSLLAGLLLGAKNSLGKVWQESFRQAGVSHIVALSGYNITIVAEGIMAALAFLPRMFSLACGAFGIFLFAIMTGGSATVLRASIMALLVLLAKASGRTYDVVRALMLAGLFMIIQNPKILVFDVSFQLSFLSTLALIYVSPLVESKFLFIPEKYKLREMFVSTLATQIFVLPFIFYKMGMVSLVSLPANILILPIIPTIMLVGFLAGMVSFISTWLAWPLVIITSLLLSYILKVIDFFAHLPFASINVKNFPLSIVVLLYILFIVVIWRYQTKLQPPTNLN